MMSFFRSKAATSHCAPKLLLGFLSLSAAILSLLCGVAIAQERTGASLPFERGEELVYRAEFSRALLRSVDVGEFHFTIDSAPAGLAPAPVGEPGLRLVGDVVTKGLFPRIAGFKLHTHVESTVELAPFTVLHTNKLDEQGKRVRNSEAIFDHQSRKVTWTERDPNQPQPPQVSEVDFSEPIQDMLSVIYFLRTQKLEPGKSFEVPLSDSGRVYRFVVAVRERKEIKSVLGKVSTIRVEPALFGENGLARRGTLSIWITEDKHHLPVKAQLKVELGTFDITLLKFTDNKTNHRAMQR
jgi:Protein of unknown function (DUF3108)